MNSQANWYDLLEENVLSNGMEIMDTSGPISVNWYDLRIGPSLKKKFGHMA